MGILSELGVKEDRLTEILKIHNESLKWMYDNLSEIQDSYSGKFIAIINKKVVDSDEDRGILFQKLSAKFDKREIEEIFIDYVNPKDVILILLLNRSEHLLQ